MKTVHRVLDPGVPESSARGLCALAIMTKAPRAGDVKTRLVPPLSHQQAAELNICFLRDTSAAILNSCRGRARGIGVYTPRGQEKAYLNILPAEFELIPQRGNDFGERLANAAADLLAIGFSGAVLIDSDSPTVSANIYAEAVAELAAPGDRVVVGPADDGGYYLIGLKEPHRALFEDIDWSTERVLNQTLEGAGKLGLETKVLPLRYDVDDRATLQRLCGDLLGDKSDPLIAPATRDFLTSLVTHQSL